MNKKKLVNLDTLKLAINPNLVDKRKFKVFADDVPLNGTMLITKDLPKFKDSGSFEFFDQRYIYTPTNKVVWEKGVTPGSEAEHACPNWEEPIWVGDNAVMTMNTMQKLGVLDRVQLPYDKGFNSETAFKAIEESKRLAVKIGNRVIGEGVTIRCNNSSNYTKLLITNDRHEIMLALVSDEEDMDLEFQPVKYKTIIEPGKYTAIDPTRYFSPNYAGEPWATFDVGVRSNVTNLIYKMDGINWLAGFHIGPV